MVAILLSKLGFVIHPEKSTFNPCQEIEYSGFEINSIKMMVSLTPANITLCDKLLPTEHAPIHSAQWVSTFKNTLLFLAKPSRKSGNCPIPSPLDIGFS